jgi:acetyl esterase/lipase
MRSLFRSHRRLAPGIASLVALAVVLGPFRSIADAQEPSIRLWQGRAPEARGDSVVDQPSLTPFLAPTAKATGTAIVIFPGGGYRHLAIDKEGNDVARWLNRLGVRIRRHVSTRTALPTPRDASRRTARRSLYPVITMDDRWAHHGSRVNLLGASPSDALVRLMSNETQVTAHTPPAFIVATADDVTVPVQNSVMFYDALLAAKVPAELHIRLAPLVSTK